MQSYCSIVLNMKLKPSAIAITHFLGHLLDIEKQNLNNHYVAQVLKVRFSNNLINKITVLKHLD